MKRKQSLKVLKTKMHIVKMFSEAVIKGFGKGIGAILAIGVASALYLGNKFISGKNVKDENKGLCNLCDDVVMEVSENERYRKIFDNLS